MQLNHHRIGSGDPLVLIHGVGSQWQIWQPVIERTARERDVIAIDLPGFGDSPTLPIGTIPNAAALADSVSSFLDGLGIERPVLGGNSLGGWVALEVAKRRPVKAVVGVSPAGFANRWEGAVGRSVLIGSARVSRRVPDLVEWLLRRPRGRVLAMGGMAGRPALMPAAAAIEATHNLARSPGFEPTIMALARDRFTGGDQVGAPVTLLWGTRDYVLFPWQVKRALRELPQARHIPLTGSGHVSMWDDPDAIARELLGA